MSARSLAPLSLALTIFVGAAGLRVSVRPSPAGPALVAASASGSPAARGPTLAAYHVLLGDAPLIEVNGDALSETAAVETAGQSRQEHREDPPALAPRGVHATPLLPRPFAALGRRAHPPTAPPRSS